MKNNLRAISLPLAFAAFLAAGFAIGRWSSQLQNDRGSLLAKSTVVTSNANSSGDALLARVPVLDGANRTALDFNVPPQNSNDEAQTFSFFIGFTR